MIYTGHYANRNVNSGFSKIRISVSTPKEYKYDDKWLSIAPDWYTLLKPYKEGLIDDAEYTRRYLGQLERQKERILSEFRALQEKHPNAILLCWCRPGAFCHRRLLAGWLEKQTGIVIPEYGHKTGTLF